MSRAETRPDRAGTSPEAVRAHYDLGDDFYALWLDPEMVYSCALFEGADDLHAAQLRKLDYHIDQARVAGAARVLDIGCGWGGLLRRLVDRGGVRCAVGLTLSRSQAAWACRTPRAGIQVREESWRDHQPAEPYDGIISIGAFEHFVHRGLDGAGKLAVYREFFESCHQALVPLGRLSLQTIAYVRPPGEVHPFLPETIFPESELPMVWEPIAAAEGRFELVALRNDRDHYVRTLRAWERNLANRWDEAVAVVGKVTAGNFRRYLRVAAGAFKLGTVCLLRLTFARID